ncbi:MAG: AAA family ATPase [Bacteroides sp.]|nr:AAA family ATPase [Bacteroides sp.]
MINNYLESQIKENFPYQPTSEQNLVLKKLAQFLFSPLADHLFLLRGYAGTGKTSLVGALVKTLDQLEQKCVLLAPTGRAAKVFSAYSGHPAFTIHKRIYRQRSFSGDMGNFSLNDNLNKHTIFIVDESSMIANDGLSGATFGTGRLLDDLVHYVYSGEGCRLLLMGDTAQLPPVGEELSPALYADALRGYGLEVTEVELTQVVRQAETSGILWNATSLRRLIADEDCWTLPKIRVSGFADVRVLPGDELIEELDNCYNRDGMDETIVICRSNKRANIYNNGIRGRILWREEELESGDLLMVAKNNYFWTEQEKEMDFIANGETAVVRRVRRERELYGFRFVDASLRFPDYGDYEVEVTLLLDTLHSDAPALSRADNERLFQAVLEDYADIPLKRDRMLKMKQDPYYNALQVKYAYAITCHKAQGGQWRNVFLDQGYLSDEFLTPDYFRWLYTAFTRAKGTLYLVNYPAEQVE